MCNRLEVDTRDFAYRATFRGYQFSLNHLTARFNERTG